MKTRLQAFTLIELLIVVAIIAILAAIAVPNFLEAQTRSKVSRVKSDMRSMSTALEAYAVDYNAYPQCNTYGAPVAAGSGASASIRVLERLSTPVAYMSSAVTRDPFLIKKRYSASTAAAMPIPTSTNPADVTQSDVVGQLNCLIYQSWSSTQRATVATGTNEPALVAARAWLLHSCGPDSAYFNMGGVLSKDRDSNIGDTIKLIYDPTNGTVSFGSIFRAGGSASPSGDASTGYAAGQGMLLAIQSQK